ncbi:hypothetical protein [Aliarcobacter butzleri]|uniref:Uncharacterized protein n=2 Tax=Aliarcobacter butzleri TaxID=28197 RepID=A0AAW6VF27_9BACT|nr:hypothetical protein [Aliarcobacter butzleri]KLD98361.1 hypothetical protein AA20_08805 [Aliarcobacter butzleri L348]MDK2040483.1 hypothetical protein [Aliarcobacter butzleri]MDK2096039.1 hypothetical protein [Aliarcobacter butzleri]MDN5105259.1 hypothetical protein [Aliarcobacter butzleri]MDS1371627.1 hypothetical protein [Aliarcobacter butzleri]
MLQKYIDSLPDDIGEKYFDLIRKKVLWEDYKYDIDKNAQEMGVRTMMNGLKESINIKIPSRDNIRYKNIEKLVEHNLSNNLLIEIIIRNKEFQKIIWYLEVVESGIENNSLTENEKKYKKLQFILIKKFGFDAKDKLKLIAHHPYINEKIGEVLVNVNNENLILNPPFISDIDNGLRRVIDFYLKKNELYVLIPPENYEIVSNEDTKNIDAIRLFAKIISPITNKEDYILLSEYEKNKQYFYRLDNLIYFLPKAKLEKLSNVDEDFIENNINLLGIPVVTFGTKKVVSVLETPFPLELLDEEFILSLSVDEAIDAHFRDTIIKPILPKLKFLNSKRVTSTINPNVSSDEVNSIILNIQNNATKIKSFSEIFDIEIEKTEAVRKSKNIALKNKQIRNKDYADAFYIYDLYHMIGNEFNNIKKKLEDEAKININKVNESSNFETKERKEYEYEKINRLLDKNKSLFSKTNLDKEIQKITNLEISKIRGLHSLMKEYIEECKFKNII